MWDPTTNKVHTVGHAHADFDECVKAGWWRGQNIGKKGKNCVLDAAVEMEWPDLVMAEEKLTRKGNWPSVDEGVRDVDGNPLPQLPALPPPQNDKCPELVSNSSGDASDQDLLEDGPE